MEALGGEAWDYATTRFGGDPLPIEAPDEACTIICLGMPGVLLVGAKSRPVPGIVHKGAGEPVHFIAGEWGLRFWIRFASASLSPGAWPAGGRPDRLRFLPVGMPWEGDLTASMETSRAGMRLLGFDQVREPLERSEPSIFGAIQAAPGGELLIHGPEGPVTGGYPKIGCLIRADLGRAAQIRPGERVRLVPVGIDEARSAWRTMPRLGGVDWR